MPKSRLWTQPDFLKLWGGQSVSLIGSSVSMLALPLTAILVLHATAGQMGIIYAIGIAPSALVGMFAGVWADRARRRPLMLLANLGRMLTMGAVPVLFLIHMLSIPWLMALAALNGILNVIFSVAYQAYLPEVVERDHLTNANSAFEGSRVFANVTGPGLAAIVIQALSAPIAVALDALSYLIAALSIGWIRRPEQTATRAPEQRHMWREMREGLAFLLRDPLLRSVMIAVSFFNFFAPMLNAQFIFYLTRDRGFTPTMIGIGIIAEGVVGVLIATLTGKISRALGVGPTMTLAGLLICGGWGIALLAPHASWVALGIFTGGAAIGTSGDVLFNINGATLRQVRTPQALLGRVSAGSSLTVWILQPIGALVGAALAQGYGARQAIIIAAAGFGLAFLSLLCSPLRTARRIEQPAVTLAHEAALLPVGEGEQVGIS